MKKVVTDGLLCAVGVWNTDAGKHELNTVDLLANKVWAAEDKHAFTVSVIKPLEPIPPVVDPEEPEIGDVPTYVAGTVYQAGDKVSAKDGNVYQCKPWSYTAWYSQASYVPAESHVWSEAWVKL